MFASDLADWLKPEGIGLGHICLPVIIDPPIRFEQLGVIERLSGQLLLIDVGLDWVDID